MWAMVKGWLDPVTVQKIHILGSSYQTELLEQVPAENLPELFGGSCVCEGGCEFSDAGPWREKQWSRPAKWETKKDVIEDKGGEAVTHDSTASQPEEAKDTTDADAAAPDPAPAPAPAGA